MAALIFFIWVLLVRWALTNERCSPLRFAGLAIALVAGALLAFSLNAGLVVLVVLVLAALAVPEYATPPAWRNAARLAGLVVTALSLMLLWRLDAAVVGLYPSAPLADLPALLGKYLAMLVGGLLLAQEANYLIRALFRHFELEPQTAATPAAAAHLDEKEYNAGRVIGILERWLIYIVLVTAQDYTVVTLVLAAKGFARFRQMDERPFAEYVLIGTLMSTLVTVVVAEVVVRFVGH